MSIFVPLTGRRQHPATSPIFTIPHGRQHTGSPDACVHVHLPPAPIPIASKAAVSRCTGNPAKPQTPAHALPTCSPTQAHPGSPQHGNHHAMQALRSPKPFPGALPGYSPPSWNRSSLGTPGAASPDAHPPHHGHLQSPGEGHGGLGTGGAHGPRFGASGAAPPRGGGTMQALPGSVQMLNNVLGQPLRRTESARWG